MAKRANKMTNTYQLAFTFTWNEKGVQNLGGGRTTDEVYTIRRSYKTLDAAMEKATNLINGTDKGGYEDYTNVISIEIIDKATKEMVWEYK